MAYETLNLNQQLPGITRGFVDKDGTLSQLWYQFFQTLYYRSGGVSVSDSIQSDLDSGIGTDAGSFVYRTSVKWTEFTKGNDGDVLQMKTGTPKWAPFDTTNFGAQGANTFLAGPGSGSGLPTFRKLTSVDLNNLSGQYPGTTTNDNANAGNIGEYQTVNTASVALTSNTVADISFITLSAGDWDIWANIATTPAAATTQSQLSAWLSPTSATDPTPPNGGAYLKAASAVPAGVSQAFPVGMTRVSLSATSTMIYLSAKATFASGTLSAYGSISARRCR